MKKIYLVTYNSDEPFNKATFHNYMSSLYPKLIEDWWHYIDTTYFILSSLSVNNFYNLIFPGIPRRYILVIEINVNNAQGWLPSKAWTWIQKYQDK